MTDIKIIEDAELKSEICEVVLKTLPDWFGVESAVLEYVEKVKQTLFVVAYIDERAVGFISVETINPSSSEIYVMGIMPGHQRLGLGHQLLSNAIEVLNEKGVSYLLVKTLSDKRPDEHYDQTKRFYLKEGFVPIYELDIWGPENPCVLMIKNLKG